MKEYQYDAPGVLDKIVTPCTVDVQDYDTKSETNINSCSINALWDTGATVSVVSESLIHRLGLIPQISPKYPDGMEFRFLQIFTT